MTNGTTDVNTMTAQVSKYFKFMNPLNLRKTYTTKFILPMVTDNTKYDQILTEHFEDSYLAIYDDPAFDDHIIRSVSP